MIAKVDYCDSGDLTRIWIPAYTCMIVVVLSILPISRCIDANSIPTRPGVHTRQQASLPPVATTSPHNTHTHTIRSGSHRKWFHTKYYIPLTNNTNKVQFQVLSDDTVTKPGLTLSSSNFKDCFHFADITSPPPPPRWGQNVEICIIFTLLPPGHQCFTNTCLVLIMIKAFNFMMHIFHALLNYSMNQIHMLPYG